MVFREDGHLSGEALEALAKNEDRFDELERLEIAEHLAFCDYCLQRYTLALEDGAFAAQTLAVLEVEVEQNNYHDCRGNHSEIVESGSATVGICGITDKCHDNQVCQKNQRNES